MRRSQALSMRIRAPPVQTAVPAAYYRGGTSRAVFFQPQHLPADRALWPALFSQTMGSGDSYGRQLDGMGAGISSLSKICLVEPHGPRRLAPRQAAGGIDVDYTFVGLGIEDDIVDVAGNCGNMSSAIGPYAYNAGLLPPRVYAQGDGEVAVRIRNTNTGKLITATFDVAAGQAAVAGDYTIDGVTGPGSKIRLDFEAPYGSKTARVLPTGNKIDRVLDYRVSCVDGANPCIFIRAGDIGVDGAVLPDDFNKLPDKLALLERIRKAAAVAMGIAPTEDAVPRTIPKIGLISMSSEHVTLSGQTLRTSQTDLVVRFLSDTQPHRAIPLTAALTTAVAARIPGTLVEQMLAPDPVVDGVITIGHASGRLQVDATMSDTDRDIPVNATVYRTAKRLFEGTSFWVNHPAAAPAEGALRSAHGSYGTHSLGMAFVLESRGQSTAELFAGDEVTQDTAEADYNALAALRALGSSNVRKSSSTNKPLTISPALHTNPTAEHSLARIRAAAASNTTSAAQGRSWHQWAKQHAKRKKSLRKRTAKLLRKEARLAAGVKPTTRAEFGIDKWGRSYDAVKRRASRHAEGSSATAAEVTKERAGVLAGRHDTGEDMKRLWREAVKAGKND